MLKNHYKIFFIIFFSLFLVISLEIYIIKPFFDLITIVFVTFLFFGFFFYLNIQNTYSLFYSKLTQLLSSFKNLLKKNKNTTVIEMEYPEFREFSDVLNRIIKIFIHQVNYKDKYAHKLEYLNSQKDEIISAISHEFKNPIAVINGYTQTLLNDYNLPISLRKKFLHKIYKNGNKLTNLIDTLRLAIKLDENKQSYNFDKVDVYLLVSEIIDDIKESYSREIQVIGNSTFIKADKILLGVAIRNLIENAIKYSEAPIKIKVERTYIKIIDQGIGIKQEDLDKITQKFYRVSNKHWNNSLGLGLSIVNNIVSLHNFKLEIKSEINKGSEFVIKFY